MNTGLWTMYFKPREDPSVQTAPFCLTGVHGRSFCGDTLLRGPIRQPFGGQDQAFGPEQPCAVATGAVRRELQVSAKILRMT